MLGSNQAIKHNGDEHPHKGLKSTIHDIRWSLPKWGQPHLWSPTIVTMNKYHGKKSIILKIIYNKPSCLSVYENLGKSSFYDWFTTTQNLKPI
jgi:hypothetical protein